MIKDTRYKVLSLFSGCGGLDLGFKKDIFDIVLAVDNDPDAIKCFHHNFECPSK